MQAEKEASSRNPVIAILIFIVLVVLPAGAIYFLNAGKNFREDYLKDLKDMGKVADFGLPNQENITVQPETMRGKVSVVQFLNSNEAGATAKVERLAKLHESFDDTDDVLFLTFIPVDSTSNLLDAAAKLGIRDSKQWYVVGTPDGDWEPMAKETFKLADPANGIALVDTTLSIRNHYDITNNDEMGKLVVHISMIIPKQKKRTGL